MSNPSESVVNNQEKHRFEVVSGSQVSKLVYELDGDTLDLVHTEVPEDLAGQGIGSALVQTALQHARDKGLKIIPSCPFVAAYVQRHPEYNDLVADFK